jgi:ATP-dependent DNA ligase
MSSGRTAPAPASRSRNDISDRFPDIVAAAEDQLPEGIVMDGVI